MFRWGKKKSTDSTESGASANGNDKALALQDPRTKVNTTRAATETTNTAVQNSTTFNTNTNTVTYSVTSKTVTHKQQASVTEIITRRTPNEEELEKLLREMNIGGLGTTSRSSTTTSSGSGNNKRSSGSNFNGVALRSTPTFKPSTAKPNRSSTVGKWEHTSVSQKQGRIVTQHVETNRVPVKPAKTNWWSKTSTPTSSTSSSSSNLNKPTASPFVPNPVDNTYVSPYTKTTIIGGTSYPTRPVLSSPKTTVGQPYRSLNPGTGAVPKRLASTASFSDSRCEQKPVAPLLAPSAVKPIIKEKLTPADVIIFNHEEFDKYDYRDGSAEDVKELEKTFKKFKCNVKTIKNATVSKVKSTVSDLEKKNFGSCSALVVVILSHGERHEMIAAKDSLYNVDDDVLFPILRNRSLLNKPKILFVQACKGHFKPGDFKTDAIQPRGAPIEVLKCYSTFEGYLSYRQETGSIFIRTLCDTLRAKPNEDIVDVMNQVRCLVMSYSQNNQIPSVTSSMTKTYSFGDYA